MTSNDTEFQLKYIKVTFWGYSESKTINFSTFSNSRIRPIDMAHIQYTNIWRVHPYQPKILKNNNN